MSGDGGRIAVGASQSGERKPAASSSPHRVVGAQTPILRRALTRRRGSGTTAVALDEQPLLVAVSLTPVQPRPGTVPTSFRTVGGVMTQWRTGSAIGLWGRTHVALTSTSRLDGHVPSSQGRRVGYFALHISTFLAPDVPSSEAQQHHCGRSPGRSLQNLTVPRQRDVETDVGVLPSSSSPPPRGISGQLLEQRCGTRRIRSACR